MSRKHLCALLLVAGVSSAGLVAGSPDRWQSSGSMAAPPSTRQEQAAKPPATSQPPAGKQTPKPSATQQEIPTFRTSIELVTTDVIVRDNRGQFVADLKKDEFEVYEDGILQDVVSMELVHGGRVYTQLAAPPPPQEEGIILPPSRPTNDAAGRILLLFVDDLHLDFRNTGRIRELFKTIKKELIHEGDMFGIVSTGPSSLAIDLTYDARRIDEAIKRISGGGLRPSEIIQGPESADGPSEVRYRAQVAFATASDIMRNLEQVRNRRKAVIFVSEGYDFNPFEKSRDGQDPFSYDQQGSSSDEEQQQQQQEQTDSSRNYLKQSQQWADADLARELAELTRIANRANATIYTIDPRGLVGMPDLDENLDPVEWQDYIRKSQDSLRVLATETGGIAVVNQNDFSQALKRIDAETSDYYVLGYYSKNPDPLKRVRKIEVKVKRRDVDVWARKGYEIKRPGRSR
ncbi:MAG: VWA domain-containing protein [Vicinamibacterales bacterium]